MPIKPVTMYQDSEGKLHATTAAAEKAEAIIEFMNYNDNLPESKPQLYHHNSQDIVDYFSPTVL